MLFLSFQMTGLPFSVILRSSVSDYSLFCSTCCSSYSIMFCTGIILHISRLIMMIVIIKSQNQVLHSYCYQRLSDDVSGQNLNLLWIPRYWIRKVKLWSSTCCTAISGFKMICFLWILYLVYFHLFHVYLWLYQDLKKILTFFTVF